MSGWNKLKKIDLSKKNEEKTERLFSSRKSVPEKIEYPVKKEPQKKVSLVVLFISVLIFGLKLLLDWIRAS